MVKPVPRLWVTLLLGLLPWLAAWLGAYRLHSIVASFFLYHVLCLTSAVYYWHRFGPREGRAFRRRHWVGLAILCLLVCFGAYALIGLLGGLVDPGKVRAGFAGEDFALTRRDEIALFLYFAVVNPFVEEFFWRGTIYTALRRSGGSVRRSALVSALLFGSWHFLIVLLFFRLALAVPITAGIVLVGLLLALFYERTRSLPAAILLHGLGADVPILVVLWFAVLAH